MAPYTSKRKQGKQKWLSQVIRGRPNRTATAPANIPTPPAGSEDPVTPESAPGTEGIGDNWDESLSDTYEIVQFPQVRRSAFILVHLLSRPPAVNLFAWGQRVWA